MSRGMNPQLNLNKVQRVVRLINQFKANERQSYDYRLGTLDIGTMLCV